MSHNTQAREQAQKQWNTTPCGQVEGDKETLQYFLDVEQERYKLQDWMTGVIPFEHYNGKKILEIGCGHGTDLARFAKHGAQCYAIDITQQHINLTRKNFSLRNFEVDVQECDATQICHPDNTFDLVYSFGVIHHIPEDEKVFREVYRVLKPGGTFCVTMYHKWSAFHILGKIITEGILEKGFWDRGYAGVLATIERGADGKEIIPYVKTYSQNMLKKLLDKTGFADNTTSIHQLCLSDFGVFYRLVSEKQLKNWASRLGWYAVAFGTKK